MPQEEQPQKRVRWEITAVRAHDLPKPGPIFLSRKCYYTIGIEGQPIKKSVNSTMSARSAVWNEISHLETDRSSTVELKVYLCHTMTADEEVGSLRQSVASLIAATGAVECIVPGSRPGSAPITVTLTIEVKPSDNGHVRTDLERAVEEAAEGVSRMHIPGKLDRPESVITTGATVADGASSFEDPWSPLLSKLQVFNTIMDDVTEAHPYAKLAWSVLSAAHKLVLTQIKRDQKILDLVAKMNNVYTFFVDTERLQDVDIHKTLFKRISQQTIECGQFISSYAQNADFRRRALKQVLSTVDDAIKKYNDKFDVLLAEFRGQAGLNTELTVLRMVDDIQQIATNMDLSDLAYVGAAHYERGKQCLDGTRTKVLDDISNWIISTADDTPRVYFVSGPAGTGKSTIAHTIATRFDDMKRLGSSFCFSANDREKRRPETLIPTIARDLADLDPVFKKALWQNVGERRSDRTKTDLGEQFDGYLLGPAKKLALTGPILIVIDALDEIGDPNARGPLLRLLAKRLIELPPNFRILLTARSEKDLKDFFRTREGLVSSYQMLTRDQDPSLLRDIRTFICTQLVDAADHRLSGLDDRSYDSLTNMSEGLFQWAFVACGYIKGDGSIGKTPEERFRTLTKSGLDDLYHVVLSQKIPDAYAMALFKSAIGFVLTAFEPLSMMCLEDLSTYLPLEDSLKVSEVLPLLGSLLSGVNEQRVAVRPLHSSFREFLMDESRSGSFYIDSSIHHKRLALASLGVLNRCLRFNICGLESSHMRNRDVPDLAMRIQTNIPLQLSYSSRHFAQHLKTSPRGSGRLVEHIKVFFQEGFLFWLEILSLIRAVNTGASSLSLVITWLLPCHADLAKLAEDGRNFTQTFAGMISESAPHIYISALMCGPSNSPLVNHFAGRYPRIPSIYTGRPGIWPPLQRIIRGHTRWVNSVAFPPDGKHLASGSWDETIRLWDAETGEAVGGPLQGHTGSVTSVAFSPDGKRIASGSWDETIRLWDAETGEAVGGPLQGHTALVYSVAFSPDGKRIASGSGDETIRLWDAETGKAVGGPLRGHTNAVTSVAFSPDGKRIASGSGDGTIRVWDAETGEAVGGPLQGHTDWVTSVAFSPDGKRIASGSGDRTIRVWDAETGEAVGGPLQGHTGWVTSVAFSPDGKHMASGSLAETIRVWDAETGEAVGGPLQGHTGSVTSVAFSPDGKRIASGSGDGTIRVWDAETGEAVGGPLQGHTDWVTSVAFSPDGKRIASGSGDRTIRVWDAETGEAVGGPLQGHTGWVTSVAFSPDGKHMASGSLAETIRVWDAETGEAVGGPLQGHTGSVTSVAFSPDGKHLASGSDDETIRVWDAETGEAVGGPLQGHTGWVTSVAFSPDGKRIASGSGDGTIRLWDAETGKAVGGPLQGHTNAVTSVAFSPDGKRIASASYDGTIRVWDAEKGEAVGGPLQGHTGWVTSVAFSPDGKRIASASYDETIRVWDAEKGEAVGGPLQGHTGWVTSVAFSPDGKRIASGSYDETIRLWDAETGKAVGGPLQGHTTVAFSPDGKHIASRSGDETIRVCDADTGEAVGTTLDDGISEATYDESDATEKGSWEKVHLPTPQTSVSDAVHNPFVFSPNPSHGLSLRYPLPHLGSEAESIKYDGDWIVFGESKLLLWLPPNSFRRLYRARTRLIIPGEMIMVDLSQFAHGPLWHECRLPAM